MAQFQQGMPALLKILQRLFLVFDCEFRLGTVDPCQPSCDGVFKIAEAGRLQNREPGTAFLAILLAADQKKA
jgi:hypothetical protein